MNALPRNTYRPLSPEATAALRDVAERLDMLALALREHLHRPANAPAAATANARDLRWYANEVASLEIAIREIYAPGSV